MRLHRIIICLHTIILIVLNHFQLFCQYPKLKFDHITTSQGLSNNSVNSIGQDETGFIWIGTEDGLNRYDGNNIKIYQSNQDDTSSLFQNNVKKVFLDSKKNLWVITSNVLGLYNKGQDNFYNIPIVDKDEGLDNFQRKLTDMVEDSYGRLLLSSINGHIYYLNYSDFTVNEITNEKVPDINCIMPYKDSVIFIGTLKGFYILNKRTRKIEYKTIVNNIKDKNLNVYSLYLHKNELWICTLGEGIIIYNIKNGYFKNFTKSLNLTGEGFLRAIQVYADINDNIWIGDAEGLKFYDSEKKQINRYDYLPQSKYSINTAGIVAIFFDNQENLWLGTSKGGVSVAVKKKKFYDLGQEYPDNVQLSQNIVSSVLIDHESNLWVGFFNGGIDVINKKTDSKSVYIHNSEDPNTLGASTVFEIFEDSKNNIWLGTYWGGLQRFDKKKNTFYTFVNNPLNPNSISGNDIRSVVEDKDNNLWIITHGVGLDKFDIKNNRFFHYSSNPHGANSMPGNWNFMLCIDSYDTLWLASSLGLCKMNYDGTVNKLYVNIPGDTQSISNNYINYIYEGLHKKLWIGTNEGLNILDRKQGKFRRFTKENGLANEDIKSILEDKKGNIWFSTNKGISRLSLKYDTLLNIVGYNVKNFDKTDGIESYSFSNKSCYFDKKSGLLYFGGSNGITYFNPDSIKDNLFIPPIVFTDFQLFYKSVPVKVDGSPLQKHINETKLIKLKYSQNIITFQFTALNFISPEKNMYAYIMEGFDKKWNYVGPENKATYTNLDPGEYTFRVRASNNDGIWNEEGRYVKIIIKPPFFRSVWGILTITLVVIIIGYYIYNFFLSRERLKTQIELERMEAKKLHEIDEMKLNFFTQISHEFRTPLTLIIGPIERLLENKRNNPKINNYYNIIYKNGQRLKQLINQLLDYRKSDEGFLKLEATHDDIIHFIEGIVSAFNYYSSQRKIKYTFTSTVKTLKTWFDPDKLDKILYNLISNAFKYTANKGKISISIDLADNLKENKDIIQKYIKITITDNGAGIPAESLDKIFLSFYQVEGKKIHRKEGTGIGLAFTKLLVEKHKGEISVKSEVGKGSSFEVLLPFGGDYLDKNQKVKKSTNLKERIASIMEESVYVEIKTFKNDVLVNDESIPLILIVEDDIDLLNYLCDELLPHFRVIEATNGYDGLIRATEAVPDLIISDVVMPNIDGIELCNKIKSNECTSHIPFILLTSRSLEEHKVEGYKTGADAYVVKPFNISVLVSVVNNLINSRKKLKKLYLNDTGKALLSLNNSTVEEKFLKKAINVIEQNISNINFDSEEFALSLNMSRSQLYRKVKALTNQSVSDLIRTVKLKKAAEMLLEQKYTVYQIADAVGYTEQSNFTRDFNKHFGKSPTEYIASKNNP